MKMGWIIVIIFLLLIVGYPIMVSYVVSTGYTHRVMSNCPECTVEAIEKKRAKLKVEHDIKVKENRKKIHDGTYEVKPWAGWPWNRENWNP